MGVTVDFGPVVSWLFRLDTEFKRDLARLLRQIDYVVSKSIDRDELPERVAAERRRLAGIPDLVDELQIVAGLSYDQACERLERELAMPRSQIDAWMEHRERLRRRAVRLARDAEICRLVRQRWPYERVGRRFNLSAARVGQIVAAGKPAAAATGYGTEEAGRVDSGTDTRAWRSTICDRLTRPS